MAAQYSCGDPGDEDIRDISPAEYGESAMKPDPQAPSTRVDQEVADLGFALSRSSCGSESDRANPMPR